MTATLWLLCGLALGAVVTSLYYRHRISSAFAELEAARRERRERMPPLGPRGDR